jgi:Uma2 family endonuclease
MSAVKKPKLTSAEYLVIERKAAFKSAFFDGEMFAMAGASYAHNRINSNLIGELHARLKETPCFALSNDMRVKVPATGLYTYPDAVIVCGQPEFEDGHHDTLLNPRVVIEVLTEPTEGYDRGAKFRQYKHIESFQEYILIVQDEPLFDRFQRQPDGNWLLSTAAGTEAELQFATVSARIPLADIYAGVAFRGSLDC